MAKGKTATILGQDQVKKVLGVAVEKDYPALLVGDTGTGKTSIIREIAEQQGKELIRFNLTGETSVDDFVGKYILKGEETIWQDGILLQAMRQGKWLVVDEVNAALQEILFVLQSLLDDDKFIVLVQKDSEVVRPHEGFRFFATMNPVDEYAGTKDLNKAFKSRFNMIVNMDYPDAETETEIVCQQSGVDQKDAHKIVDIGHKIRQAKKEAEVFYTCSTRDLIQWGNLVEMLGFEEAFQLAVLNKANGDAERILHIYAEVVGDYANLEKEVNHELSIDWFKKQQASITRRQRNLNKKKDELRAEIKADILEKLTSEEKTAIVDDEVEILEDEKVDTATVSEE